MLCYKDSYGVIEKFFDENVDFLYWKDINELKNLIYKILENYDKYKFLADNAYEKAINNYTTEKFIYNYLIPNSD